MHNQGLGLCFNTQLGQSLDSVLTLYDYRGVGGGWGLQVINDIAASKMKSSHNENDNTRGSGKFMPAI